MEFLSSIPTWVWILLAVAAVIVTPIKFKIFKNILANAKKKNEQAMMDE